ncbi:alpha/beta fold hydrolase [Deinococcus arenae]|uniref:alpha/beta fold hydrolase n=1 Tax=Deinococcus arenae TaxID=1452751 RepID=UPI0013A5FB91|nr:alpha/beta fold hydrolase [Deinococcus arenae]
MIRPRTVLPLLLGTLGTVMAGGGQPAPTPRSGLAPTPCIYELPSGFTEPRTADCFTLTVPEWHGRPGRTLTLHGIRLHGTDPAHHPDPVFYLHGGPGGNVYGPMQEIGASLVTAAGGRDVIFFNQRGSHLSSPLTCPNLNSLDDALALLSADDQVALTATAAASTFCRDHLRSTGINLNAYNVGQIAADIDRLRQALGATQVNLYGVSYGTRVAQEVLRRFPTTVRSAVLDAPVPADTTAKLPYGTTFTQALHGTFAKCAQDATCNETYPDAEARFGALLERLDRERPTVSVLNENIGVVTVTLTSSNVLRMIFLSLYRGQPPLHLPGLINPAYNGSYNEIAQAVASSLDYGEYDAALEVITCADGDTGQSRDTAIGDWPQVQHWSKQTAALEHASCAAFQLQRDPLLTQPVQSKTPTLILAGGLDPITPPAYAQVLVPYLTNPQVVVFPHTGHAQVRGGSNCALSLLRAFWATPTAKVNTRCVGS